MGRSRRIRNLQIGVTTLRHLETNITAVDITTAITIAESIAAHWAMVSATLIKDGEGGFTLHSAGAKQSIDQARDAGVIIAGVHPIVVGPTQHGGTGNQNASKPPEERKTENLYIVCTTAEKAAWRAAAGKTRFSAWVRATLNTAAKTQTD